MDKLSFCVDCRRIFLQDEECIYCNSQNTKEMKENSPVNVIGTKIKGNTLKSYDGQVNVLVSAEKNAKSIKTFEVEKLRKIL